MEIYPILSVWKILVGHAPNCGIQLAPDSQCLGRKRQIPRLKLSGTAAIQTQQEQYFQIN